MKKSKKRLLAFALAVLIAFSLTGCGNSSNTTTTDNTTNSTTPSSTESQDTSSTASSTDSGDTTQYTDPITLDVFNMNTAFSGEQAGWLGKYIKDRWNMTLNLIPNDGQADAKFQVLAASGNLADIVIFPNPGQNFQQAVAAGSLLYDISKDNAFATHMPYFNEHFPVAVERMKTFSSDGGLYGIPTRVSMMEPTQSQNATEVNFGVMIRYDYYLGAGSPALNTLDDLVPCLQKIAAAYPTNEAGNPTYAASIYNGMDGNAGMAHALAFEGLYGYDAIMPGSVLYVDSMAENSQDVLMSDSYYMKGLKFFFQLNQLGLLDPDSLTQTQSDASAKFSEGQILYSNWYWEAKNAFNNTDNVAAGKGYAMAPLKDQKISSPGFYPGGDNGPVIALGSKCKDVNRALDFIDWIYTPDGIMTLYNGAEGLTWEYDANNKPYMTDFGKQALPMNKVDVPAEWGGSTFADGFQQLSLYPVSNAETNPISGEAYKYANWSNTLASAMSNLDKLWSENMGGARYTKEYLVQNNMLSVIPGNTFTLPALSDDMKAMSDQVGNIIKQYSWKMVLAENEKEFNSLCTEMTSKAKDLGYDTLLAYYKDLLPTVHQARVDAVNSVK